MKIKTEQDISYPEARRLCESKTARPAIYVQAAAAKTVSSVNKSTVTTRSIETQTDITFDIGTNT